MDRRAVRQRDQQIAVLFDESYASLRGLAYVMLGDAAAAEEVVMEAFEKTFSGWNRFRALEHPQAYLRQIVVNLCRSRFWRHRVRWDWLELAFFGLWGSVSGGAGDQRTERKMRP